MGSFSSGKAGVAASTTVGVAAMGVSTSLEMGATTFEDRMGVATSEDGMGVSTSNGEMNVSDEEALINIFISRTSSASVVSALLCSAI